MNVTAQMDTVPDYVGVDDAEIEPKALYGPCIDRWERRGGGAEVSEPGVAAAV